MGTHLQNYYFLGIINNYFKTPLFHIPMPIMLFLTILEVKLHFKITILHYLHYANFDHFKMSLNKNEINQDKIEFNIHHMKFKLIPQPHQN